MFFLRFSIFKFSTTRGGGLVSVRCAVSLFYLLIDSYTTNIAGLFSTKNTELTVSVPSLTLLRIITVATDLLQVSWTDQKSTLCVHFVFVQMSIAACIPWCMFSAFRRDTAFWYGYAFKSLERVKRRSNKIIRRRKQPEVRRACSQDNAFLKKTLYYSQENFL